MSFMILNVLTESISFSSAQLVPVTSYLLSPPSEQNTHYISVMFHAHITLCFVFVECFIHEKSVCNKSVTVFAMCFNTSSAVTLCLFSMFLEVK